MEEDYTINISTEDFRCLQDSELIQKDEDKSTESNSCIGLSRAYNWFLNCSCATISACCDGQTREERIKKTEELVGILRKLGYGVSKITGHWEGGKENSFLVVNLNDENEFLQRMFALSQRFNQISFIFKKAGKNAKAIEYRTSDEPNDHFGDKYKLVLGRVHINPSDAKNYSMVRNGKFAFANK